MMRPVTQPRTSDQRQCITSENLGQMFQLSLETPEMFVWGLPSHRVRACAKANRPITAGSTPIPDSRPVMP